MSEHVCPVWVGYLLASPIRKLIQNPQTILGPLVRPGMTVLDVGCAMGFFSLPAAKMVGASGRVVCVDCQTKMLDKLEKRAHAAGVGSQIEIRACTVDTLGLQDLEGRVDIALAIAMVHEAPDPERLLREIAHTLKPSGKLLIAEPTVHVSETQIQETLHITESLGLRVIETPAVKRTASFILARSA